MKLTETFRKHANAYEGNRYVVSQGGTSSGKTYSILQLLYIIAENKDNLLISIVSESMPHLRRGAMRDFFKILTENGIYIRENHNKTDSTYKVGNSLIEFFSADQSGKVRGARRDILYINECNGLSYDIYTELEIRTRKKVVLDYNPVAPFWAMDKVANKTDAGFVKTTYLDNDQLDDNIVKAIESRKGEENWFRVYGRGEVGSLEGVVFPTWEYAELPESYNWEGIGIDFGYTNDPTAIVRVRRQGDNIYVQELCYQHRMTSQDIINKLKELGLTKRDEIIGDSADPRLIDEIGVHFNIRGAAKGKDSIKAGIDLLHRFNLNITKDSVNLSKEFQNYTWKVDKNGKSLNVPVDDFNHLCDSIRYICQYKIKPYQGSWMDNL